jgi:hypothetical protein
MTSAKDLKEVRFPSEISCKYGSLSCLFSLKFVGVMLS